MHVLINEADEINGLESLNSLLQGVLSVLPDVHQALTQNVTQPLLLHLWLKEKGITLSPDWCKRAATYISLKYELPIPKALVLKDEMFFSFMLICRLMRW